MIGSWCCHFGGNAAQTQKDLLTHAGPLEIGPGFEWSLGMFVRCERV
jgi:hypothetical protein